MSSEIAKALLGESSASRLARGDGEVRYEMNVRRAIRAQSGYPDWRPAHNDPEAADYDEDEDVEDPAETAISALEVGFDSILEYGRKKKIDPRELAKMAVWLSEYDESYPGQDIAWLCLKYEGSSFENAGGLSENYSGSFADRDAWVANELENYEVPDWVDGYINTDRLGSDWEMDYTVIEEDDEDGDGQRHYFSS